MPEFEYPFKASFLDPDNGLSIGSVDAARTHEDGVTALSVELMLNVDNDEPIEDPTALMFVERLIRGRVAFEFTEEGKIEWTKHLEEELARVRGRYEKALERVLKKFPNS